MNLEYEFTEQDYIDFNIYHLHNSPTLKRVLYIQRYGAALLFMLLAPIMYWISKRPLLYYVIYFAVISIIWIIISPKLYEKSYKKRILKMVDEGKRNYLFGKHELKISQDGIHGKTEASETTWNRIERAVETDKHILIYINSLSAIVVPKYVFVTIEEKNRFMEELNKFK